LFPIGVAKIVYLSYAISSNHYASSFGENFAKPRYTDRKKQPRFARKNKEIPAKPSSFYRKSGWEKGKEGFSQGFFLIHMLVMIFPF
jgi:hypothetical protein